MSTRPWRVRTIAAVAALVTGGVLAGCSSSSPSTGSSSSGPTGVLTITTGAAGAFADDFNLFSPNAEDPTNGMIYEPLFFFDTAKAGAVQPWLGTSYAWSNGGKTRDGAAQARREVDRRQAVHQRGRRVHVRPGDHSTWR